MTANFDNYFNGLQLEIGPFIRAIGIVFTFKTILFSIILRSGYLGLLYDCPVYFTSSLQNAVGFLIISNFLIISGGI